MTAITRTIIRPAAVATLCTLAVLTSACSKKAPPPKAAVPVTLAAAKEAAVPFTITTNGVVQPMQTVAVQAQVNGILNEVDFTEGQDVSEGQVLFRIDPRPFQAALDQANATLARDQAQSQSASRDAERYLALVQRDYVTKSQSDQAQATAASAGATVAADQAAVETARLNLAYCVIRAPISGRTGSLLVRKGNVVKSLSTPPLVVINQIHPIQVRFAVPQSQFNDIRDYASKGKLVVRASPSEGSGASVDGTLSFIDNSVDSTTGTVSLKATFANANNALWPGQFVNITLQLYVQQGAIVVPSQAVLTGQQGTYVFTVDTKNTAQQILVSAGRIVDSMIVVDSGLTAGTHVVIDGQAKLIPGSKVEVQSGSEGANDKPKRAGT